MPHQRSYNPNCSQLPCTITVFRIPDSLKCFQVFFIPLTVNFREHTHMQSGFGNTN